MDNEETNSAELAAEEILREAYVQARAEECPQGKDCAVHFRVDEEFVDEDSRYARLITYVGEYVVLTEDNHVLTGPAALLDLLLGGVATTVPPQYETSIFFVGEGAVGDIGGNSFDEVGRALRYAKTHNDWEAVPAEHYATVSALKAGLIDVSKPWEG